MAYQARRKKLYEEDFELVDENGVTCHVLHVALDPDAMAAKLSAKHLALVKALQKVHSVDAKESPEEALEVIGNATTDILEAVFGQEDAKTIIGFYNGKYIMMTKEVIPFVTEVVIPEVRKMAQKNRKEIAAGYGRPKALFFGRK